MVEEADADDFCGGLGGLGQFAVVVRRSGVAARVIVGEEEAAGLVGQGALDDVPDVHVRLVNGPALETHRGHGRVLGIHNDDACLFLKQAFQLRMKSGPKLDCIDSGQGFSA